MSRKEENNNVKCLRNVYLICLNRHFPIFSASYTHFHWLCAVHLYYTDENQSHFGFVCLFSIFLNIFFKMLANVSSWQVFYFPFVSFHLAQPSKCFYIVSKFLGSPYFVCMKSLVRNVNLISTSAIVSCLFRITAIRDERSEEEKRTKLLNGFWIANRIGVVAVEK